MSRFKGTIFTVGAFAGGNIISMGLRFAGGVLQARCVAPPLIGLFNGIGLVMAYAPLLHLGVLDGLSREWPLYAGKGDHKLADEFASAAQAWALAVGVIAAAALFSVAGVQFIQGNITQAWGWVTYGALAGIFFYNAYLQMTYRSAQDFAKLAGLNIIVNGVSIALVLLPMLFGFYGLCLRAFGTALLALALLHWHRPRRVCAAWNWMRTRQLLSIGIPILVVGYLYSFWGVLNSTLVLHYMGTTGLGVYSVVILIIGSLELLPQAVEQVVYPRMAEEYGRTGNVAKLTRIWMVPALASLCCMVVLLAAARGLVDPIFRLVLPAYIAAVPVIKWSLLLPALAAVMPAGAIFNVIRRQDIHMTAIVAGMIVYALALVVLNHGSPSLTAFPKALIIGRVTYLCVAAIRLYQLHVAAQSVGAMELVPRDDAITRT